MANFDNIGEFNLDQLLTKRLTTPGGAVAPTVAPELFGVITLENDRTEWGYIKGERICSRTVYKAAVVGQYNMVQMYLPTTSRELVTITSITARVADAMNVCRLVGISGGLGGWVAYATTTADTRWQGDRTSLIMELTANAALPTRFGAMWQFAGNGQQTTQEFVIAPGGAIAILSNVVNVEMSVNVTWRERGAQPGELI